MAWQRAQQAGGTLIYRDDDLDRARCKAEYSQAAMEDLHWLGLNWTEGPDVGGPCSPYVQSARYGIYRDALERLHAGGYLFSCTRSRRDVQEAAGAPHEGGTEDEPVYPREFRPPQDSPPAPLSFTGEQNWRFRVPHGRKLSFVDEACGLQEATAGEDLGDFVVWRRDDTPSYKLACTVDDATMGITEVVRGRDLIRSTFRQLLLYEALGWKIPQFYHCPLVTDEAGQRLAKRHDALSLRTLRSKGMKPEEIIAGF